MRPNIRDVFGRRLQLDDGNPTLEPTQPPGSSLSGTTSPWWVDLVVVIGLILMFMIVLRILMGFSNRWKKMMKERITKALEKRKAYNDPFRKDNGYSWDYVLVFKVYQATDKLTKVQEEKSFKFVLNKLAEAGLETKLFYSVQVCVRLKISWFPYLMSIFYIVKERRGVLQDSSTIEAPHERSRSSELCPPIGTKCCRESTTSW